MNSPTLSTDRTAFLRAARETQRISVKQLRSLHEIHRIWREVPHLPQFMDQLSCRWNLLHRPPSS